MRLGIGLNLTFELVGGEGVEMELGIRLNLTFELVGGEGVEIGLRIGCDFISRVLILKG